MVNLEHTVAGQNRICFKNLDITIKPSKTKCTTYRNVPKFSEQSDQGLHYLLFYLHLLEKFLCCKATLLEF